MITSYPRKSVATERASSTFRSFTSATVWNASAPATRVTGSKSTSLTWPLRLTSSTACSCVSCFGTPGGPAVAVEYGFGTPPFRTALPCASKSIGRFLKHMKFASAELEDGGDAPEVAVGGLQAGEELRERTVDRRQLFRKRPDVTGNRFEPVRDRGDALARLDERPGNGDQIPGEREDDERDGDECQDQEYGHGLTPRVRRGPSPRYRAS